MNTQTGRIAAQKGNARNTPGGISPSPASPMKGEFASLKEAAVVIQRIRAAALKELEEVRKMKADARRYQQETATKARSEAQQLVLRTRLATQREVEELIRQASEEIQKVLADIRIIRITAQEELAAQRKFTDAAKLSTMSLAIKKDMSKSGTRKKKQLASMK
jgi:acyl-CoA reductase-like NAD-dependent aldehyde dehydrogenase